jgi:drug/metabolite transporter (DMT)-like permease
VHAAPTQTRPRPVFAVIAWMTGALACFVGAAIAVRILSRHADVFQIGLVRTGIGLALILVALALFPSLRERISTADPWSHLLRNGVHATGGVFWTAAIATLPFATVFSLEFTAPAWVALLAYPLLRERVSGRAAAGIAACTVGALIILQPGLGPWDPNLLFAVGAAFCFALSVILTRRLALRESTLSILLWMMVLQSVFYGVGAAILDSPPPPRWTAEMLMALPLLGIAGLGSQICLTKALSIGEAAMVVPLDFLRVPLISLVGFLFYGESISFSLVAGAALILGGIGFGLMPQTTAAESVPDQEVAIDPLSPLSGSLAVAAPSPAER